jgi:hypothetical protein
MSSEQDWHISSIRQNLDISKSIRLFNSNRYTASPEIVSFSDKMNAAVMETVYLSRH